MKFITLHITDTKLTVSVNIHQIGYLIQNEETTTISIGGDQIEVDESVIEIQNKISLC